jgi:acyl-CoA synthetase (NDP forming)
VQGLRTWASLDDLPEVPEVAIVAVPGDAGVAAVKRCADAGTQAVVLMASGFGEVDEAGKAREREMTAYARARGMRIIGPNTQGLANFGSGAVLSFSTMFTEAPPADGPVGIISQSGAMSVIPYGLLRARGIGVRHAHATGNDADVTVCELATVVAEDPGLKVLLMYLEGIPDPWHLAEAAAVARDRGLPIVALKSGRTAAGQQAAQSHTGALASEDRVVDAFLAEHGIWRVNDMVQLVDATELYLQGWKPKGRRLVAISNSGAVCVLTADAATEAGMPLQPLADDTQAALRQILPGFATTTNPVDITAALLSNSRLFSDILPPIGADPAADAFLIGVAVAGAGYDVPTFAADSAKFAADTGKPVVVAAPQTSVAAAFKQLGLPVYPTEAEAVRALGQFLSHTELLAAVAARRPPLPAKARPQRATQLLHEADSLALLAAAGVPVARTACAARRDEARAAFAELGAAEVVVKGCSDQVTHKSDLGPGEAGPGDRRRGGQAFADVQAAAAKAGVPLAGVLVAERVRGRRELMIGARATRCSAPWCWWATGACTWKPCPTPRCCCRPSTRRAWNRRCAACASRRCWTACVVNRRWTWRPSAPPRWRWAR